MLKTSFQKFSALRHQVGGVCSASVLFLVLISAHPVNAQSSSGSTNAAGKADGAVATGEPSSSLPSTKEQLNAQRERGQNLVMGINIAPDKKEGLRLLEDAIEKGDRKSLIVLGRLYMDGQFLKRDLRRAMDLFQRAAQKGDFEGVEALGETLMWDARTADQRREAERLLTMAGTGGRGSAWTTLAYGAIYGKLNSTAASKYRTYVENARAAGDTQIEIVEAERLLYRTGKRGNPGAAVAGLEKAAAGGNPDAIKYLVKLFRDGNDASIRRNLVKARAYLNKYGTKLPPEAQQQQALLIRAAAARTNNQFAELARAGREQPNFTSTAFQRQIYQTNQNFSIYLAQQMLQEKNKYSGPLNGRATRRTMLALRDACKTLVWKGNCDKKILSDRALAAIIAN